MTVLALESDPSGVTIHVFVQPGASRTVVCGMHGDAVKVRVAAAPEKGAANRALSAFLADVTGVRKTSVRIVGGTTSRHKTVRIDGVLEDEVRRALSLDEDS